LSKARRHGEKKEKGRGKVCYQIKRGEGGDKDALKGKNEDGTFAVLSRKGEETLPLLTRKSVS